MCSAATVGICRWVVLPWSAISSRSDSRNPPDGVAVNDGAVRSTWCCPAAGSTAAFSILRRLVFLLLLFLAISGLHPYDRVTWWMEVAPALIALPILVATHRRFPCTSLVYALIFVHAVILMVGGAYTGFVAQTLANDLIICVRD